MGNVSQTGVEPLAEAVGLHLSDVQTVSVYPTFAVRGTESTNLPLLKSPAFLQ